MIVPQARLISLFKKVEQLREEARAYTLAGDRSVLGVEDIQALVERMYNVRISKKEVVSTSVFLHSMVLRYGDGSAQILARANLPDPAKRFGVTKELCHLMLDEPEDWSVRGADTIDSLIRVFSLDVSQNGDHEPDDQIIVCEALAELAAAELLYPFSAREADLAALENRTISYAKLAIEWKLPQRIIELALHPGNLKIHREIQQAGLLIG